MYYLCRLRLRGVLLLIASLFVCAWGSSESLLFLLLFIFINWAFGLLLEKHPNTLSLAVICDIAFLCMFKYMGMAAMPIGISFYTLSGISYCTDVARKDSPAARNPGKLAIFIAFFPKLTMGPFVLYKDFEPQIDMPSVNCDMVAHGMLKFSTGLAKKAVIAASFIDMANDCWVDAPYSTASAWLGLIAFTLELYYDFSGYSDMAIGLSEMLGFEVKENFIYPYESSSLSEFWSRWHASLSEWLKNYIYYPLGGNRKGESRAYFNMFIVWLVSGLWHGSGFNFICWGMFLFLFLYLEKSREWNKKLPKAAGILITDLIVILGWVFFNSASAADAVSYFGYLIGESSQLTDGTAILYFDKYFPLMLITAVGCTSFPKTCAKQIFSEDQTITVIAKCIFILAMLTLSTVYIVKFGYTPFIYQSF